MGSIVSYARLAGKKKAPKRDEIMYGKLVDRLRENPATKYTIAEAENLADEVLKIGGYDDQNHSMPVIDIAKDFGFTTFRIKHMPTNSSGNIFVGGTTKDIYGTDRVIIIDNDEEFYHQRFIIAHELGHYLMDYVGNPVYSDIRKVFTCNYPKTNHVSENEQRSDRFAAELLMPAKAFYREYIRGMNVFYGDMKYIVEYLSSHFETKKSSIKRRIQELIY